MASPPLVEGDVVDAEHPKYQRTGIARLIEL